MLIKQIIVFNFFMDISPKVLAAVWFQEGQTKTVQFNSFCV